jgi:ribosome-associated heat shock protein Hsp15
MGRHGQEDEPLALAEVRLDVWLDVTCLFPTRAQAAAACAGGKVDLNGHAASAHKSVRVGDRLAITFSRAKRTFLVKGLLERHVKKSEARRLFEETTPPPSPEVLEARRLERLLAPRDGGGSRPTKKERRQRERARGW